MTGMQYIGGFFNLLNPFAVYGGLMFVMLFILIGAYFLVIRTADPVESAARKLANQLWLPVMLDDHCLWSLRYGCLGEKAVIWDGIP